MMSLNKFSGLVASVLTAGILAVPFTATAGDKASGLYVGLTGGLNALSETDVSGGGIGSDIEFDPGWALAPAIGYKFENGLRAEFEGAFRSNDVEDITGVAGSGGDAESLSAMINVLYDFDDMVDIGGVTPYLGLGFGFAQIDFDNIAPLGGSTLSDTEDALAYQAMAGLAYQISDAVTLVAEYRYFATNGLDMALVSGTAVDVDYESHGALVGLRWSFGGPKSAPKAAVKPLPAAPKMEMAKAPEPAPAKAAGPRAFIVFFDWDSDALTPASIGILESAATYARNVGLVRIEATGHADRSGTDIYNMGLSQRRADAVKAELVSLGIGDDDIGVAAKGEADPLVSTADGIREPQNRRVEIDIK